MTVQDQWSRYRLTQHDVLIAANAAAAAAASAAASGLTASIATAVAEASTAAALAGSAGTLASGMIGSANGVNGHMFATSLPTTRPDGSPLVTGDRCDITTGTLPPVVIASYYWNVGGTGWVGTVLAPGAFTTVDASVVSTGILDSIIIRAKWIETSAGVGTGATGSVLSGLLATNQDVRPSGGAVPSNVGTDGGFFLYNEDGPVAAFDIASGDLTLTGGIFTAPTISSGSITATDYRTAATGTRLVIGPALGTDRITGYYGSSSSASGVIQALTDGWNILGIGSSSVSIEVSGNSDQVIITGNLSMATGAISTSAITGGPAIGGTPTFPNGFTNNGGNITLSSLNGAVGSSSTANMFITSAGVVLKTSASFRALKKNIKPMPNPRRIFDLDVVEFRYKKSVIDEDRTHVGGTIEQALEAGLHEFVDLDPETGEPCNLAYPKIALPLIPIVHEHDGAIAVIIPTVREHAASITDLLSRIEKLEKAA